MTLPLYSPLHTPLRSPLRSPRDSKWYAGVQPGVIHLSNTEIDDDIAIGDLVGVLSVVAGSGSYTFSIVSDPDNKFILDVGDNTRLELENTVDADIDTTHNVTIEADNGVGSPLSRTFTIVVSQPGLDALMLSASTIDENTATGTVVGTLSGMTAGSSLTLFDSAGTRFAINGNDIETGVTLTDYSSGASHTITVRETLTGSPNSPRDTDFVVTVNNVAPVLSGLTVTPIDPYTTATIAVDTTDGDGTIYFVIVPTAEAAPNASQIVLGQNAAGTAATWAGNVAVSGIDTYMSGPSGLTADAVYDCYAIHYDSEGTGSNIVTTEFTSGASGTPVAGNPMGLLLTLTYPA